MEWRSALADLLLKLYPASELRMEAILLGAAMGQRFDLPGEIATDTFLAFHVVSMAERMGWVGTLLDRAAEQRPARAEEVARVRRAWEQDSERWPGLYAPRELDPVQRGALRERDALLRERAELEAKGGDLTGLDARILEVKRRLRDGVQLQPGDELDGGRYELLEEAGRGGFAVVWRAYDRVRKRLVAVRVLHAQHARSEERRERFERGARTMDQHRHPRIVPIYEQEREDRGHVFQVLAYMAGGDLHRAVLERRLSGQEALEALLVASEALDHAHAQGLVHRDMKPHNVLLDHRGSAFLADFDLVLKRESTGGTHTGASFGSFLYAAPEVVENAKVADPRSDVYGLGMSALFCLAGRDLPLQVIRDASGFIRGLAQNVRRRIG